MSSKATWMSGGSGSGVYDPVTTGDTPGVQYHDSDDGWLRFKGRKYNFGTYRNTGLKGLCDEVRSRSRPKCLFMIFIAVVLLILLLMIIVIAASRQAKGSTGFEQWQERSTGLNFRPVGQEKTVFLPFSIQSQDSYLGYMDQLDNALKPYDTIHIHNGPNIVCNSTYNPMDKVCQQPLTVFGTSCVRTHSYGYHAGQPCVLLYFSMPQNYSVEPLLPNDGEIYTRAEKVLGDRFSVEHVGISCGPATAEDKKYVGNTSAQGNAIEYNPAKGFPLYFFRPRTIETFVPPAVMVQFLSIRDSVKEPHMVKLTCTAWAKAFDTQRKPVDNDLLSTSLVFRIR